MGRLKVHPCGPGNWPISSGHRTVNPSRPNHNGSDVLVVKKPQYAPIDGFATRYDQPGGAGYYVKVTAGPMFTYQFHLSRIDIPNGAIVKAGDQIGISGGVPGEPGAGNTTGAHLHFEIWILVNGVWININPEPDLTAVMHTPLPGGAAPIPPVITPPTTEEDVFDMGTMTREELKDLMLEVQNETTAPWEKDTRKYAAGHTICEHRGGNYYIDTDGKTGAPVKVLIPDADMFWMLAGARFLSSGPVFTPGTNPNHNDAQKAMEIVAFESLPVRYFTTHGT